MADSFNKKEREKKRQKRKKEKAARKLQRKEEGVQGEEFMYVDEDGNLTATPPDPTKKRKEYSIEDVMISTPKKDASDVSSFTRNGQVKFFNSEKGYGFIIDNVTKDSFFVHVEGCIDKITDNDKVSFEVGKGPKGPIATGVKLYKEPKPVAKPPVEDAKPTEPKAEAKPTDTKADVKPTDAKDDAAPTAPKE